MSEHLYLLSIGLVLGTILLIFGMRYASAVQQAKARLDQGEAVRKLAETAAGAQVQTAAALTAIEATLADIAVRLGSVEKILKEVE